MSQKIPLSGIIGFPVGHSKSPRMHRHWLARYGLAGDYVPLEIAAGDFGEVVRVLPKAGFVGANVTIPHKLSALQIADEVTDSARAIGAANTLVFRDGAIHADNTDAPGFLANLVQGAPDWDPKAGPAAVIGAGGAARAVLHALCEAGVPEIRLSNRTREKAEDLGAAFGDTIHVSDWSEVAGTMDGATLVVNTTSLGMQGAAPFDIPLDDLAPTATVTDLVYVPLETPLLTGARARGCTVVDGLGMLLHQGVPGFERWFGLRPEVDAELREVMLA